ncbi:intraflagellar transport protein 88 homolog [Coregonus clupeaformis]|uniref:intraflagellar transport protein 88 homolog n=1 Tax=Coregonus clupeaformis TaxID=59861 RepID=UPI001E1C6175|nr:intraflagellar transport protein 88 homolog [Coregonus clupeaformis]XP_045065137.1 intraflagellar transport protein 88 homolog [Coregonus clupeaformis]
MCILLVTKKMTCTRATTDTLKHLIQRSMKMMLVFSKQSGKLMTAQFPGIDIGGRALGTSFGSRMQMDSSMGRPMTGAVQRQREDEEGFSEAHLCLLGIDEEDKYIPPNDDTHANLVIEAIKNDKFHQMERERKALAEKLIMTSAKLISPTIAAGFDWCVDMVKSSQYIELANDLEITKAITYLR